MLRKIPLLSIIVVLCLLTVQSQGEQREWSLAVGNFTVKAEMLRLDGETLHLRRADDGKEFSIELSQLSPQDQDYARKQSDGKEGAGKTGMPPANMAVDDDALNARMLQLAKKHGLLTLNGLPAVRLDNFVPYDPTKPGSNEKRKSLERELATERAQLAKFLDLVTLGLDPEYAKENLPTFVANHFPKEVVKIYIGSKMQTGGAVGVWKGKDEFEKRAAEQSFREKYSDQVSAMAVKLPIRLLFIAEANFGSYDFSRKGLAVSERNPSEGDRIPGTAWAEALPPLPSANYSSVYRKGLNVSGLPVHGTTFWQVDAASVKTLPSRKFSFPGQQDRITRSAYLATEVTLKSIPLLGKVERQAPLIVGRVDSISLYAEPELRTKLKQFEFRQFPESVLENGSDAVLAKKNQALPLDELVLGSLVARGQSQVLPKDVWKGIWAHLSGQDRIFYQNAWKAAGDEFAPVARSIRRVGGSQSQADIEKKNELLAEAKAASDRAMQPSRRPFFPPDPVAKGGRYTYEGVESLTGEQQGLLTKWLAKRTETAGDRFTILAKIRSAPGTEEPTFVHYPIDPETLARLEKGGGKPGQLLSLNENMAYDERGQLKQRGTKTELFQANGKGLDFFLRFPFPVDTLLKKLPKDIVEESLLAHQKNNNPPAIQLEFHVDRIERMDFAGNGSAAVVLNVTPQRMRVFRDERTAVFDEALDVASLTKMGDEPAPMAPIPKIARPGQGAVKFTPQMLLPLLAKQHPGFLDNERYLDQLMVMRWKFENVGMFDVKMSKDRFFKRGSPSLPDRAARQKEEGRFKEWSKAWAQSFPDQFSVKFDSFDFRDFLPDGPPGPAILLGAGNRQSVVGLPSNFAYNLKNGLFNPKMSAQEAEAWVQVFSIAPRDVLLDREFIIPDAEGNAHKTNSGRQVVAGIPVAAKAEPIFPIMRFDKEIWLPENGQLAPSNRKPQLEVAFEAGKIEMVNKRPPHPWGEGMSYFKSRGMDEKHRAESIKSYYDYYENGGDNTQYAIIEVALKSARLVDPESGKTLLPLVLKDYRKATIPGKAGKVGMKDDKKASTGTDVITDREIVGVHLGMSFEKAETAIRQYMDVGRVLETDRSKQVRGIKPYTSGKLFVSKDEKEYLAIFDEPPAAEKKVVGMWLRRHVSKAERSSDELMNILTNKYGKPSKEYGVGEGTVRLYWLPGQNEELCLSHHLDRYEHMGQNEMWLEDGERTQWRPKGQGDGKMGKTVEESRLWLPRLQPNRLHSIKENVARTLDKQMIEKGVPSLGAEIGIPSWNSVSNEAPDQILTFWMVDPGKYVQLFRENQRTLGN